MCRKGYPLQWYMLCVCKLSVKYRKVSTEMAKTFSILFGQLVDVVTLECSVLYFTPIKTMHSAWKCFCLHGVRRTCYCIYAIERVAFPTHKSSLSFQELFSPGESGRHFQWLSVKNGTSKPACYLWRGNKSVILLQLCTVVSRIFGLGEESNGEKGVGVLRNNWSVGKV